MKFAITRSALHTTITDCLVVPVFENTGLNGDGEQLDAAAGKAVSTLLRSGDVTGKTGETLMLHGLSGVRAKRVLLVGCGEARKFDGRAYRKAVQTALKAVNATPAASAHLLFSSADITDRDAAWGVSRVAQEVVDGLYQYDRTKSRKAPAVRLKLVSMSAAKGAQRKSLEDAAALGRAVGLGMNTAKELGNLPGNICTPTYLAKEAEKLGKRYPKLKVSSLSEAQMRRLGMGSLLSVSAGSAQEARLIILQYRGAAADSKPYALVGKGITFDTGGISLKPGLAMDEMKYDMCGAASVLGTLTAVAELKLPINVVGLIAAAENMPSGTATKPGDVVTSMSGKTIEILNTDAEGRLVLCDALTYAERFKPRTVIDIATLTGAAVATFGSVVSALLANDQGFAETLLKHGEDCLDPAWQLPLKEEYQSLLDSRFADIANIGGPKAGTITAACFLSRFTEKFVWAHLDIAGSAWNSGAEKAATGRPVPLLVEYLRHQKA